MMKPCTLMLTALVIGLAAAPASAQILPIVTPEKLQWVDDDEPGAPSGLKVAVLFGDPSKSKSYVLRVKFSPNSTFPLHTHARTENLTVLTGTFGTTFGSSDRSKGHLLPAGSFISIPANTAHFVWTGDAETIVQIHGIGPDKTRILNKRSSATAR